MRTKILLLALLTSNLLFGQFGDKLLQEKISKQSLVQKKLTNIQEFGECEANCYDTAVFTPLLNSSTFNVSHGSPTFYSNGIWMWSYANSRNIRGEGVFTNFRFIKGKQYCVEVDVELSRSGTTEPINVNATFNFDAANSISSNPRGSGGGDLPNVTSKQGIISGNYANGGYPLNTTFRIKKTFTANDSYGQLWIYPRNPGRPHPQLNMKVSKLVIKEVTSCPCMIEGSIKFKKGENCEYQFFGNLNGSSNTRITGYLWNFGDGTTSTEQNPFYTYAKRGSYQVTMTAYGVNSDGECCTKVFKTKVYVEKDCPQECEIKSNFKVVKKGWWFWGSCDLINTSTSNVFTTIVGYEWYIDGVLVSKNKDIKNYKGRGKNVCLVVYGIDKNGNCCSNKYCEKIR